MQLGSVVGTATTTVKHRSIKGVKLLVVQLLSADGNSPDGNPILAIDQVGAGRGDRVLVTSDGDAVQKMLTDANTPVRWSVMGVAD
jgi:ethanolamine utilization protein EutN